MIRSMPAAPDRGGAHVSMRVLVLAPLEGDAAAVSQALRRGGFDALVCEDVACVAGEIAREEHTGAGVVVVAQEAVAAAAGDEHRRLARVLADQPEWSDLPLILLAGVAVGEQVAWEIARGLDPVGNISILERPLRRTTLLNAVAVALRARARQYDLRTILRELAQHREQLEEAVARKTAELAASMATLRASERLAALGTLAAGLGHDIANLTLPIRARLDALAKSHASADDREDLDAIGVAITHLSQLSAGMRLIGMDPERTSASALVNDLAALAAELAPMLRAALPRHIRLVYDIPSALRAGVARHRLAQAIFNLVQNAGEAMAAQGSGEVRVSAGPITDASGRPMVRVRVADNGPGMSPEVRSRCFEPYFSTKGRAIATGMGLAMVKGIVEAAGGTIALESSPGKGTLFTLTLPAIIVPEHTRGLPGPDRTGAVTVSNGRIASLACLFMEELGLTCVRHQGPGVPSASLWVVDNPDAARVSEYLANDRHRRGVVLADASGNGKRSFSGVGPEASARIIMLPKSPTPAALRDAVLLARSAAATHA